MKFEKLFSVMYVLEDIALTNDLKSPEIVFQTASGIFSAKPFIVDTDGKTIRYSYVSNRPYSPIRLEYVAMTESLAVDFLGALSIPGSPHNRWATIKGLFVDLPLLFDFLSDQYDEYESEKTNTMFPRKMYGVSFLDKNLDFDYTYVDEDINVLSVKAS